jgi:membrane-bound serine protease (ClpP class)
VEIVIALSAVAVGLLLAEVLLPTGGVLAFIGAAGFVAAGIVALGEDSDAAEYIGPGLITLGVLSVITTVIVGRKVYRSQTETPIRTGKEEMIGREAEVRSTLDPIGQIWADGALWRAKPADEGTPIAPGNRVLVESVDGLTLVVRPLEKKTTGVED